ncbi:alpha/beta hydrolase [Nocardiopsis sp. RSe5-2]|uniref:Alpha/beta hydrolase n=1 Tax=Nocardiopsis endophytica TaxID=3018445 RepID=A0ABT4UA45_9ACTN|nr:alpha/beta hydrolase [Nocardiopsis endophytica]MDA2813606.1 alpha/beta hydrolase [Nocardiopsis endophytica]
MDPHLSGGAEQTTLSVRGLSFDALAAGPLDGPLALFLHGFPEFSTCWREQLAAAARAGFRAVAVDQRGYSPGARPEDTSAYTVDELVEDLFGFADALEYERFHLVAHDWGGVLAWPAAYRRPERIRTLTVLSTPHPRALTEVVRTSKEQQEKLSYIGLFRMVGKAEEVLLEDGAARLRDVYEGRVPEALVEDNVRRLSEPGALTAALSWYRALQGDAADAGAVQAPTLYMWGEGDLAFGAEAAEGTGAWVEGPYEYVRLDNATHWLPEEDPERIIPAILEHFKRG